MRLPGPGAKPSQADFLRSGALIPVGDSAFSGSRIDWRAAFPSGQGSVAYSSSSPGLHFRGYFFAHLTIMISILSKACLTASALFVLTGVAAAQSPQGSLTGSTILTNEMFGSSVAIDGDTAIIGAIFHEGVGINSGVAYIFERTGTTWSESVELLSSDEDEDDRFGWSSALSGDLAVVSARYNADAGYGSGSAYVFERVAGVWSETAKLVASEEKNNDFFGNSITVDGNTIVVGSTGQDGVQFDSGAAYVFEKVGGVWTQTSILKSDSPQMGDNLGSRLSLNDADGYLAVSARGIDGVAANVGGVFVYERVGGVWSQAALLTPADGGTSDIFGSSVSIDGNTLAIGSALHDGNGTDAGAVYMYERIAGTWTFTQKIVATNGVTLDYFGASVSVSGDNLLLGAWGDDGAGFNVGRVYKYQRLGAEWFETSQLVSGGSTFNENFGSSVSLDGDSAVIAARGDLAGGKTYFYKGFERVPLYGTMCPGSGGFRPILSMNGSPEPGESGKITLKDGPGGQPSFLLVGLSTANILLPNGCFQVINPETTFFRMNLSAGGDGDGMKSLPVTVPTDLGTVSIYFQSFVIDPGVPFGYTLSNGFELDLL